MATSLLESYLDNGIRSTHFFNGRILDAAALRTDQTAVRDHFRQFGSALGAGVAWGFEVKIEKPGTDREAPQVTVSEGVAINRAGQVVELRLSPRPGDCTAANADGAPAKTLSVALAKNADDPADAGKFHPCVTASLPSVDGIFLLAVSPVSGFRERAPMKSLSTLGKEAGCGSRYEVEGLFFRLVALPALPETLKDDRPDTLQNRVAHFCFGTPELLAFKGYPFDAPDKYGVEDKLRETKLLSDCDVPLAVLRWSGNHLQFCDMWSVRRPLMPFLPSLSFPDALSARRSAELFAIFQQFHEQIRELSGKSDTIHLPKVAAEFRFRYLPAGGVLPAGERGFEANAFFNNFAEGGEFKPSKFDAAFARPLLSQSLLADPIDVKAHPPPLLSLYTVTNGSKEEFLLFLREPPK